MDKFIINSQQQIDLKTFDPNDTDGLSKDSIKEEYSNLQKEFAHLQDVSMLPKNFHYFIVLQGIDCSGKDGTIRKLLNRINPNGFKIERFKEPTQEELGHNYLWRIHKSVPQKGFITVFNRPI